MTEADLRKAADGIAKLLLGRGALMKSPLIWTADGSGNVCITGYGGV